MLNAGAQNPLELPFKLIFNQHSSQIHFCAHATILSFAHVHVNNVVEKSCLSFENILPKA